MTTISHVGARGARLTLAGMVWSVLASGSAWAQTSGDPNPGALTFTGAVDFASVYFFRGGVRQERDPGLTLWPSGDIGLALFSGEGGLRSVGVNFGVWNSLQTGSNGSDGPTKRLHYEEDFYATLALGFGGGVSLGTTFTAYSSPNGMFTTVKELNFKLSRADRLAPYGVLALELTDEGQADEGSRKGTYLELGVGPTWRLGGGGPSLAVPVKVGLSLQDYYEGISGDEMFGFFSIGALVTVPLKVVPSQFGSWNVHAGTDVLLLGDTTRLFNAGEKRKVVGLVGIGLAY